MMEKVSYLEEYTRSFSQLSDQIKKGFTNLKEKLDELKDDFSKTPSDENLNVSILRGAINAGIWGSLSGGPITATSSIVGSSLGTLIGQKTNNPLLSITSSALISSVFSASINLLMGVNNPLFLALSSFLSSLASVIGNLTSTSSKEINDTNNFAMKLLPIAFLLKFPILPVEVSNFANQLSGIFEADEKKKLILSALTSLGLGFSLGITGGPINALIFGFVSTALSLLNSKVGSKVENFSNKLSNFISSKVQSFLSPKLDFLSKLPKGLKALIGGLIVGGITALPASTLAGLLFPILGPLSFVIALSIFTATTLSTSKKILDLHNYKEKVFKTVDSIDKSIQNDDLKSALESYKELLKTNLNNSIQVDSLSEDQLRQALFNELYLMYLQKSFLEYQANKLDESIEYFRKAVAIQKVFEGMKYEEATKIANSLNSDQIMQYLKQYAENNEKYAENNEIKEK